ncbi:unnamed protein product [Penicillium salamii]|nr:unnamed protein product [Penicillium salamii]
MFTFRIVNVALQKTEKRSINFPRQQGHIKREHDWACQPSSYPQVPYQFLTPAQVAQVAWHLHLIRPCGERVVFHVETIMLYTMA